ncbi:hypothetical protein ABIA30_004030 [Mycobacterium sp. MAA66]|uniref:hypothetical protein n=1 Tax=Mycobacterium sp. MAA66 TaxID=3156297 RepID=UPI0035186900
MNSTLSLLATVLALTVSVAALAIAWSQLHIERDAAGGRGLIFDVTAPRHGLNFTPNVSEDAEFRIKLCFVGNTRDGVSLGVVRYNDPSGSDRVEKPIALNQTLWPGSTSDHTFTVKKDSLAGLWCVLSWIEPYGDGVRVCAFRRPLRETAARDEAGKIVQLEQWRWFRFMRQRRRIQSWGQRQQWKTVKRVVGQPRPLGRWRPYLLRDLEPGQGPVVSPIDRALVPESQFAEVRAPLRQIVFDTNPTEQP